MEENKTSGYTNIRVLKSTHANLKRMIDRLGTSWIRLFDAISLMSDEEVDRVIKPLIEKYDEEKGVSDYVLMKRLRMLKKDDPEELKKFIDSL